MLIRTLSCAALLAAISSPALAGNFYVVGALGQAQLEEDASQIDRELSALGLTNLSTNFDKSSSGYKLQVGYQFNPNFAIEGGYADLGKYKYDFSANGLRGQMDVKASGIGISALGMLPLDESITGFLKLGTIHAKVKNNLQITNTITGASVSAAESASSWSTVLGIGGNFKLAQNMDLRVEYEKFYKLGEQDTTGEGDVRLISLGVSYKF
jgi:OOP family OmpA-OmpF porin